MALRIVTENGNGQLHIPFDDEDLKRIVSDRLKTQTKYPERVVSFVDAQDIERVTEAEAIEYTEAVMATSAALVTDKGRC